MRGMELAGGLSLAEGIAVLAALTLAAFLGGALLAARRRPMRLRLAAGALYALAAAALAMVILRPAAVATSEKQTRPRVAVLVDRSASMREADLPTGVERYRLAADLLRQGSPLRGELEHRARPIYLAFDSQVRGVSPTDLDGPPAGGATDVVRGLTAALDSPGAGPLAGIVMITDGRATRGPPLGLRLAGIAGRKVPVWVVGAGEEGAPARPRLALVDFQPPETAVIGQVIALDASVRALNMPGRKVTVRLLINGKEAARSELTAASGDARLPVRFDYAAKAQGVHRFEIVAGAPGPKPAPSARSSRYLIVRGRPLRAFYAEARLGWGYRALAGSLASAPGSELELWTGFVRGGKQDLKLAGRLARLDTVVLGDVPASRLGRKNLAALARAVREDGLGLLFTAAPERAASYAGTPLEPLLPVKLKYGKVAAESRRVELAAAGRRPQPLRLDRSGDIDHRLWKSLPATRAGWKPGAPRPGAQVWLRAGTDPALVAWPAGAGRVAVLAWPDHWRWSRSGPAGAEGHRRLFARTAAWLAGRDESGSGKLALSMTRYRLTGGEQVSLLARLLESPPDGSRATLRAEIGPPGAGGDLKPRDLRLATAAPGRFRATVRAGAPGEYRVRVTATSPQGRWARAELLFTVEGSDFEMENPAPEFSALRGLAVASGGAFLGPAEAERLPGMLARALPQPRARTRRIRRSLWDHPALLAMALLAGCLAWLMLRDSPDKEKAA